MTLLKQTIPEKPVFPHPTRNPPETNVRSGVCLFPRTNPEGRLSLDSVKPGSERKARLSQHRERGERETGGGKEKREGIY